MAKTRACSVGDASVCILVSSESLFLNSSRASGHHEAEIGEKGVIWETREWGGSDLVERDRWGLALRGNKGEEGGLL